METALLLTRTNFFLTSSSSDEPFVREHITELRELIIQHNKHYYISSDPVISDSEYDQLFALLQEREDRFPDLIVAHTPTQRLIGQKIDAFASARHLAEMISLQNTYSAHDIAKRDEGLRRIQKKQAISDRTYIIEPKLDGMSVELVYEFGTFTRAVTRGDGEIGEEITQHARGLSGLPVFIDGLKDIAQIAFRGEIVLPKDAFARLHGVMTTSGGAFANARNAAAGTLRQLDSSLVQKRGLAVYVYDILFVSGDINCSSADEQFALFRTWGLPILEGLQTYTSIEEVIAWVHAPATKQLADEQPIDLDGLVIKIQEFSIREQFGSTNHHPKRAIAYKFPAQQMVTKLEEVSFQVGRTGILTPVAHLLPVQLSGVTISRASLHNRAFIQERGLRKGDRVMIQRSGEVIPYIVASLPERREGTETEIQQPVHCPVCTHPVYLDDRALALRCGNATCDAQIKQRLEHAVSKNCLDIAGLGPSLIESFVDAGLLHTVADIFTLLTVEKKQILRGLPGVAEKKIALLEKEINQATQLPLRRVINSLGIRHIGEVSSRDLSARYGEIQPPSARNIEDFIRFCLQEEQLQMIHGFGKEMIHALQLFFQDQSNVSLVTRLDSYGVINRSPREHTTGSGLLEDIRLVVTGSFPCPREELLTYLRTHGATVQSAVSSQTQLVVAGTGGGSKRALAQQAGIPVLTLDELIQKYNLPEIHNGGGEDSPSHSSPIIQQSSLF